jgi:hypothetical protein
METLIVLAAALGIGTALALGLRRYGRLNPRGADGPEKEQQAESWLPRGGGRG